MSASVCANGHSKGPSLWVCGMNGDHPPELLGAAWARAPLTAPLTGQVSPALSLFCTAPPLSHGQCETHSHKCLSQSPVLGCCTQRPRHTGQGPMTDEIAGSPVKEQGNACNALRHAASSSLRFLSTRHGGYKAISYRAAACRGEGPAFVREVPSPWPQGHRGAGTRFQTSCPCPHTATLGAAGDAV